MPTVTTTRAPVAAPSRPAQPPKAPARATRSNIARKSNSQGIPPAVRLGAGPSSGGGEPLAPTVQMAIESSLHEDMQGVRVHSDSRAQSANRNLSARAFAHGPNIFLGSGESPTDLGLMAHEAAHVVQQRGAPTIQRYTPGSGDTHECWG